MSKDYSLSSFAQAGNEAETIGWYRTKVDPVSIRALMEKSDTIAMRDTVIWLGLMVLTGAVGVALWPSLWSVPFWFVYGVLYGSASDSRWHECGHQTAFKTQWMNSVVYQIASFMLMRNPVAWRASHIRHHTDTIVVGRDPEIVAMRPPDLLRILLDLFGIIYTYNAFGRMLLHAIGRLHPDEETYIRVENQPALIFVARIWVAIYLIVIGVSIWMGSILPLMLIGLPRFYGAWHSVMTGLLQHLGLAENVTDHRLNTRTVLMGRINRFIYLNMNYHLEHHMFTMVPYYNLPKLHELIRHDVPAPDPSIFSAFRRLLPVLVRQLRHEDAVIVPQLPEGAAPYRPEVERLLPHAV